MKKFVLISVFFLCFFGNINGQKATSLDSLMTKKSLLVNEGKSDEAILFFDSLIPTLNNLTKANALLLKGTAYRELSKYDKAIQSFLSSLSIYEDFNDKVGQCKNYAEIGIVYSYKGDIKSSKENIFKSLKIAESLKDSALIAKSAMSLTFSYDAIGHIDSCIYYSNLALKFINHKKDPKTILALYSNLSIFYFRNKNYRQAENFIKKHLYVVEKEGPPNSVANSLGILGMIYSEQNENKQAQECFDKAYKIAKETGDIYLIGTVCEELYNFNKKIGNCEKALYFNELQASYYDSIVNKESIKKIEELNATYQFDRLNKESKIKDLEVEKKSQAVNYLIVVASLILLTVVVIGFGYSRKKKANSLLEAKNKEIEHQKSEIVDSINYAKRIQSATLGSPDRVVELYNNAAVIFQPKDIVSGDFYWFHKIGNRFMFSVADCTGHGVPGAMMSMIGNNGLNDAVKEKGITDPAKVLEHLSLQVHTNFNKNVTEIKDGMDITFCELNTDTRVLEFAGAINPLIICKYNGEIVEIKGDKQFIGQKDSAYTNHSIQLEKGDCIYIMSDGFVDQFGGSNNKKFKISNFKSLLPTINSHEAQYQAGFLTSAINDWKGTTEQTDDICVMVVKI